jgi:hypothetical protein
MQTPPTKKKYSQVSIQRRRVLAAAGTRTIVKAASVAGLATSMRGGSWKEDACLYHEGCSSGAPCALRTGQRFPNGLVKMVHAC